MLATSGRHGRTTIILFYLYSVTCVSGVKFVPPVMNLKEKTSLLWSTMLQTRLASVLQQVNRLWLVSDVSSTFCHPTLACKMFLRSDTEHVQDIPNVMCVMCSGPSLLQARSEINAPCLNMVTGKLSIHGSHLKCNLWFVYILRNW